MKSKCVAPLCPLLFSLAPLAAQSTLMTVTGVTPGSDEFGAALASLGDVNGDGWPDLVVGAPGDARHGAGAGSASVISGRSGLPLYTVFGTEPGEGFGYSAANVGDVNHDGADDFAIGAPHNSRFVSDAGAGYLFSGRDGALLQSWFGFIWAGHCGQAVAAVGDQDLDGTRDWVIGAPGAGLILVLSGRTGNVINAVVYTGLGASLAGAMDLTGDGRPDVVCGTPQEGSAGPGFLQLYSGATGTLVRSYPGSAAYEQMGQAVAILRDLDGDGVPEVLGGAPQGRSNGSIPDRQGMVRLYSGATAAVLFTVYGSNDQDHFGQCITNAGDVDGDGKDDFLVGAPNGRNLQSVRAGYVRLYSGATRALLAEWHGTTANEQLGRSVADAGNWDRYGAVDFALGRAGAGRVALLSLRNLALTSDVQALSLVGTGAQTLQLSAGVLHSRKAYLLLGSMAGVAPGIPIGNVTLPLNYDPYFELTLGGLTPPLINNVGFLDATGRAQAFWSTFPGIPSELVGTVLHHAFLVIGNGLTVDFASNPASLVLLP